MEPMIHVQEATYTLRSDGGEMRATAHVGSQDITTHWPITDGDGNLPLLLAQMMPTIQDVTFRTTTEGSEITITLAIGGRGYECRLPIQEGDEELKQALERLLGEIDRKLADTLQSYLRDVSPPERDVAG
jgi:hypothetical protein